MTASDIPSRKTAQNAMLPVAHVHFFSAEEHTADIFATLSGDWRFGRVTIEQKGQGIEDAVELYSGSTSPAVVVVQTADTGPEFKEKLEKLAEYCAEGTSALVIGPVNDVQLYRTLTALGVSDYLVDPVSPYDMGEAISRTLLRMLGASGSHLIGVVGAKGGVGTSSIANLIATACAEKLGQRTLLMDAAAGHSTLWAQFGLTPTGTLTEAAKAAVDRDHDTLSRILMAVSEHLTFLNTGAEPMLDNQSAHRVFEMLLDRMLAQYPLVVVDLSSTSPIIQSHVLSRAHGIFFASTPMVHSLSLTKTLIKEVQTMRGNETGDMRLVLNRAGEAGKSEVPVKDLEAALGLGVSVEIPYAPRLFMGAESEGKRPGLMPEGRRYVDAFTGLLPELLGLNTATPEGEKSKAGFLSGFLGKGK